MKFLVVYFFFKYFPVIFFSVIVIVVVHAPLYFLLYRFREFSECSSCFVELRLFSYPSWVGIVCVSAPYSTLTCAILPTKCLNWNRSQFQILQIKKKNELINELIFFQHNTTTTSVFVCLLRIISYARLLFRSTCRRGMCGNW